MECAQDTVVLIIRVHSRLNGEFPFHLECSTFRNMDKDRVVEILGNIAVLLDLNGENPFKSRAYVNAARALEGVSEPLELLIAEKRLAGIRGIGESLHKKIEELITTGKLTYYEELKAATPPGLVA